MKVPNAEFAVIKDKKLLSYLLSEEHLAGKSKAKFFKSIGYTKNNLEELKVLLKEHLKNSEINKIESNAFGTKYIIDGKFKSKNSNMFYNLRCIWFIDRNKDFPVLITAYPLGSK